MMSSSLSLILQSTRGEFFYMDLSLVRLIFSSNGWGATAVDGLDTAIIMGLDDIANVILAYIPTIDFTTSYQNESVSLFETTIRYIGGMLAAYDLLTGPFSSLAANQTEEVNALLTQSITLADVLKFAFNTTTGIPVNDNFINNQTDADDPPDQNGIATIGTLVLEWTRLSDLSGDASYGELAQKGESYLLNPQPTSAEPFPGLVGQDVNITTGKFIDAIGGWVGGNDSFYEYLIKMFVYNSALFANYKDRWVAAADSTIQYLTSHPQTRPDLTYIAEFNGTTLIDESEHLACFDGGNFILGGLVLQEQKYVDYGIALAEGCHNTYASDATGIGPEVFSWNATDVPADQAQFFDEHGFWIENSDYVLRPEYIESLYYAYRATSNTTYQDWSWEAYLAINKTTYVGSGYSDIANVNEEGGGGFLNTQESFFFAEVLKYAYLIHAPDGPYQANYQGEEQWVYNTEAQ